MDIIRTPSKYLTSNDIAAEGTDATFDSWTSDGFDLDGDASEYNFSGRTYVGWNWKAGGTASSNTDGSITSSVSANTTAGFSVVKFTTDSATGDATVGHGLSEAPTLIFMKNIDNAYNWDVYQVTATPAGIGRLKLNSSDAVTAQDPFNGTPTSSVFTYNQAYNGASGHDIVAYCFHNVEGYSNIGTFVAASVPSYPNPGSFVYCGFRPKYLMTKNTTGSAGNWYIQDTDRDPYNLSTNHLSANVSGAEGSDNAFDILSNGFQDYGNWGSNYSGETILYVAFAETPFKTANAR